MDKNDSLQGRSFTKIENDVIEANLSVYALATYVVLRRHINGKNLAWPGYRRIAGMAGCSRNRAITALDELIAKGFIVREHRLGTSNLYSIPQGSPPGGPPKPEVVHVMDGGSPPGGPPKPEVVHVMDGGSPPGGRGVVHGVDPNKTNGKRLNKEREELEKKEPNSPSPSLFDSLKEIRQRRYDDLKDLKWQIYSKNDLIKNFLQNNGPGALELAYDEYIKSDEKGLIKSNHSTAIFLSQIDEWNGRAKERQPELFDYESKKSVPICPKCKVKVHYDICRHCGWDSRDPDGSKNRAAIAKWTPQQHQDFKDFNEGKKSMWQIMTETRKRKAEQANREKEKIS